MPLSHEESDGIEPNKKRKKKRRLKEKTVLKKKRSGAVQLVYYFVSVSRSMGSTLAGECVSDYKDKTISSTVCKLGKLVSLFKSVSICDAEQ